MVISPMEDLHLLIYLGKEDFPPVAAADSLEFVVVEAQRSDLATK